MKDRGYLDYCRLHCIHLVGSFFVARPKSNLHASRIDFRSKDKLARIIERAYPYSLIAGHRIGKCRKRNETLLLSHKQRPKSNEKVTKVT